MRNDNPRIAFQLPEGVSRASRFGEDGISFAGYHPFPLGEIFSSFTKCMMSRYRRIDPRIWDDERIRAYDFFTQDLFWYILTNPQTNQIGLYVWRHELAYSDLLPRWENAAEQFYAIAKDNDNTLPGGLRECLTGTDSSSLRWAYHRAWQALLENSRIAFHEPTRVLFVHNFLKYEPPASHLNVLGWKTLLHDLPLGHPFFPQLRDALEKFVDSSKVAACIEALDQALPPALTKHSTSPPPSPHTRAGLSQDQDQDQDQDQESTKRGTPRRGILADQDFLAQLRQNPAYQRIDFDKELGKLDAWLLTPKGRGKKKTRGRVVHWLNGALEELPLPRQPERPYGISR